MRAATDAAGTAASRKYSAIGSLAWDEPDRVA